MFETTPIIYIGVRDAYRDGLFGTGKWERDQIKLVPNDVARKMVVHTGVYRETARKVNAAGELVQTSDDVAVVEINHPTKEQKEIDQAEGLQAQVNGMNKAAMIEFAQVHYGQKLDGRASAADIRTQVMRLIDQYGPQ